MAEDDQPGSFHTTQEESVRQAEAAFGGGSGSGDSAFGAAAPSDSAFGSVTPSAATSPSAPTGIPGVRPPRRFLRRVFVALVALAIVAGIVLGIASLVTSISDTVKTTRSISSGPHIPSLPGAPNPPATPSPPKPSGGPTHNFTAAGLARTKAIAQRLAGRGARIELARVTADQLQLIARAGTRRRVVLVSSGFTRAIDTPGGGLTGNEYSFAQLDPAALARFLGGLTRAYRVRPSAIDYVVLIRNPVSKQLEWSAYPRNGGGHFQADARGGSLRRFG